MPSMSYCAFENTSIEIDQLMQMVGGAIDDNEKLDLNRYEARYFSTLQFRLQNLQELLEQYAEHFACAEAEEDDDA